MNSFQLCEDYLVSSLDVDNACDRIQAAQTYRLDDLKRKTLEYIEENTKVPGREIAFVVIEHLMSMTLLA